MRVVSVRSDRTPDSYILRAGRRTARGTVYGEYRYTAPRASALASLPQDARDAYSAFHGWIAQYLAGARRARPAAVIVWNYEGRPMVDLGGGAARSEVGPLAAEGAGGAGWQVDAKRPRCAACRRAQI